MVWTCRGGIVDMHEQTRKTSVTFHRFSETEHAEGWKSKTNC